MTSGKVGVDDYMTATGATAADLEGLPHVELWPTLAQEALHGLPGRIVQAVEPYTEADPAATLANVLTAAGNCIGPGPHALVQHDRHPARLYVTLVGPTAKGRKGLSWSTPYHLLAQVEEKWARACVRSGLSSGEGLIFHVRDERWEKKAVKKGGGGGSRERAGR